MEDTNSTRISWSDREKDVNWNQYEARVLEMSMFIDDTNDLSVLDLGAGQMYLRRILPAHTAYYPVDYIRRCDQTIVCDFNKKEFPDVKADVAFLSGILEYISDVVWFFDCITNSVNKIILSYSCIDSFPDIEYRQSRGWQSNLTTDEIITAFHARGFMLSQRNQRNTVQPLLCFIKATPEHLHNNYLCSGCSACANICPIDALILEPNENGFFRPLVNRQKCIKCNKCVQVCPTLHPIYNNTPTPSCYAYCADDITRFNSSSGGVFPLLAHKILASGGVVCGAAWKKDFGVQHILIDDPEELSALLRSKYLQSEVGFVYRQVQNRLEAGLPVLFSGCPCQVAALNSYLGKPYELLYTIDLLCHYSPSTRHFQQYLDDTFGRENIASYTFRTKEPGWSPDAHKVIFKDGTEDIRRFHQDLYQQTFHSRILMNDACESCRFCSFPRQGDISVGDFHGIDEHDTSLNDTKGISVLLVNSDKGHHLLEMLQADGMACREVPLEWVMNNRVSDKFFIHPSRDRLYALTKYMPFNKAAEYVVRPRYDVGIVGVWSVENYGSNMTYYALYRVIRDMGLEPLMIERPLESEWKPHPTPVGFKYNPYRPFDLAPLKTYKWEMRQLNNQCNLFLVGSDQLLNSYLYLQFGRYITLDWVDDNKTKAAYATSFGADRFTECDDIRAEIAYFLKKFDCLSFRDDASITFAKNKMNLNADQVLDPVFLCDKKHFDDLVAKGKAPTEKYIAAYILDPDSDKKVLLTSVEKHLQLNANIHTDIVHKHDIIGQTWGLSVSEYAFNEDWLRSIAQSEFVVTDSFHGMCFAIIYRKPFLAVLNERRGSARFTSLLQTLELQDRLISHSSQLQEKLSHLLDIDYDHTFLLLEKEIKKSRIWLEKALVPVMGKSKSSYDLLKDRLQEIGQRFAGIDQFAALVEHRLGGVVQFTNDAKQCLTNVDQFAGHVEHSLTEIDQFTKNMATQLAAIEANNAQIIHDFLECNTTYQSMNQRIALLEDELRRIYTSKSYFIGRCATFLPRRLVLFLRKVYAKLTG